MEILSVNVGLPRLIEYNGEPIATAIFKDPVQGRVVVGETNLEGDRQADLRVHGGYYKAVYVYPSEHYNFWNQELSDVQLSFGMFGENLTTSGILESEVRVGDRLRIGTAEFKITQPRVPCYKLNIRFGRNDMIKRFAKSGRSGFYLSIEKEGELGSGDRVEIIGRASGTPSIEDIVKEKFKLD